MGTGGKIAIGCAAVAAVAAIVVVVAFGGAVFWLKGKTEEFAAEQGRIDELQKKANANPFSTPSDGVVREDRLVKFLEVRRKVFDVYQRHEDTLRAIADKKEGDLGDVRTAFGVINELRLAVAQGQADAGMSEAEYRWLVEQVYKSLWATEVQRAEAAQRASAEMKKEAERVRREATRLDVPEPNLALFRKHESEIRKYAMSGLDWIGL